MQCCFIWVTFCRTGLFAVLCHWLFLNHLFWSECETIFREEELFRIGDFGWKLGKNGLSVVLGASLGSCSPVTHHFPSHYPPSYSVCSTANKTSLHIHSVAPHVVLCTNRTLLLPPLCTSSTHQMVQVRELVSIFFAVYTIWPSKLLIQALLTTQSKGQA